MKKNACCCAAACMLLASGARAVVYIDDFSVGSGFIDAPGGETTVIHSDFSVERVGAITGNGSSGSGGSYVVVDGWLGISADAFSSVEATFEYGNAAGYDFTQTETLSAPIHEAFFLDLLTIDQGSVEVALTVDGVTVTRVLTTADQGSRIFFRFSEFAGVDFTKVMNIGYRFSQALGVDASFDNLGAYGRAPAVPEPALLVSALLGVGAFGRRLQKA